MNDFVLMPTKPFSYRLQSCSTRNSSHENNGFWILKGEVSTTVSKEKKSLMNDQQQ